MNQFRSDDKDQLLLTGGCLIEAKGTANKRHIAKERDAIRIGSKRILNETCHS